MLDGDGTCPWLSMWGLLLLLENMTTSSLWDFSNKWCIILGPTHKQNSGYKESIYVLQLTVVLLLLTKLVF